MSGQEKIGPFEQAFVSLSPAPHGLDRDQLMFAAGQASAISARGGAFATLLWPISTATMTGLAAVLALVLVLKPAAVPERPSVENGAGERASVSPPSQNVVVGPSTLRDAWQVSTDSWLATGNPVLLGRSATSQWAKSMRPEEPLRRDERVINQPANDETPKSYYELRKDFF